MSDTVDRWLPHIDLARCTGCGDCITHCPTQSLGWSGEKVTVARPDSCCYSGTCEAVCPVGAITLHYTVHLADTAAERDPMSIYAYFPNLIEALPEIAPDSIVSRTLHSADGVKAVLFGFAAGQELSEHTASVPATLVFLQGSADLTLGDDHLSAEPGTWAHMPAHMPHSVKAKTPVVMLLLMIRAKEGA